MTTNSPTYIQNLVSIITPMYNGAAFIDEMIVSVLNQTYKDWELIIVDDCSPDEKNGINAVKKYSDTRINLIESTVNLGSSGARNLALQASRGQYIAFLDSDDIWDLTFLEEQLDFLRQKQAILVFSSYRRIDECNTREVLSPFMVPQQVDYKAMLKSCPIFPSTALYDISQCRKYFFNEQMGSLRDDYVYWLEMLKDIPAGFGNSKVLVSYRMRGNSATANKKKVIAPQWHVLRKVERLSVIWSTYYLLCWAIISYFKYRK